MSEDSESGLRRTLQAKAEQVDVSEGGSPPEVGGPVRSRALISLAAAAIVLVGLVGGLLLVTRSDDQSVTPAASTPSTTTVPTTTVPTTAPSTTTPATGPPDAPGEPIVLVPGGAELAVVGVAADDVLNVRVGPGDEFDVAYTLGPLQDAVATGQGWLTPAGAVWAEISQGGRTGWAENAFLLRPGSTDDVTASVGPLQAETMVDLARMVGEAVTGDEGLHLTVVDGPHAGDLTEITVDVLGLQNDAAGGYRLHVFAVGESVDGPYDLRTVESTVLCNLADSVGCL